MAEKTAIPKGTRDFNPLEASRRNYIFDTVKHIFNLYGYAPIETPAMENLSTLLGKYGEEGDKLLFKILKFSAFALEVCVKRADQQYGQNGVKRQNQGLY